MIGILNNDKSITGIYLHFDGFTHNAGKILREHYTTVEKVEALMTLGDLSILGPEIGEKQDFEGERNRDWCLAYGRDRGEPDTDAQTFNNLADYCYREYNYVFDGKTWLCYDHKGVAIKW
jgi:hypothetical protein